MHCFKLLAAPISYPDANSNKNVIVLSCTALGQEAKMKSHCENTFGCTCKIVLSNPPTPPIQTHQTSSKFGYFYVNRKTQSVNKTRRTDRITELNVLFLFFALGSRKFFFFTSSCLRRAVSLCNPVCSLVQRVRNRKSHYQHGHPLYLNRVVIYILKSRQRRHLRLHWLNASKNKM